MARRALWRSGAAKDAVPRIAHLDRDRPLVEAAQREPARFEALYRRYLARVYSYAYYELGDHHAAEDATEATFVSALTNLQRFEERARPSDGEGASTFRVWLFQIARNEVAGELWDRLLAAGEEHGILACGLGARDTLRTEMGYPLHGQDISIDVTANQARLGWAVGWKKERFWGRDVLMAEKETGPKRQLRGLLADGRGIPRPGMMVFLAPDVPLAEITSGTFSPTLRKGIGMALVPTFVNPEAELMVDVRGRRELFRSTKLPFVDPSVRES